MELTSGDLYVFYTDGLSEATDAAGREFGSPRIMEVVERLQAEPARKIVDAIFEAVAAFRGDRPPADDMMPIRSAGLSDSRQNALTAPAGPGTPLAGRDIQVRTSCQPSVASSSR